MKPDFEPWIKYVDLTQERLSVIADEIRRVGLDCVVGHNPEEGDTPWGLGTRRYERTKFAIEGLSDKNDWLTLNPETHHLAFSFNIGLVPLRYYRGDAEDPPSKQLVHSFGEQLCLDFYKVPPDDVVLRIVSEVNEVTLLVERVCLTEIDNDTKDVIAVYEVPFSAAGSNVLPMKAAPVTMPPAVALPKRTQKEEQEVNAVAK